MLPLVTPLDPTRTALRSRLVQTLDALLSNAGTDAVLDAIAAPSGSGALAALLADAQPAAAFAAPSPLAAAAARGAAAKDAYLASTPCLTPGEASGALGVTTEALRKRARQHTLLALPLADGSHAYPVWQFTDTGIIPGLAPVWRALGGPPPWTFARQLDTIAATDSADGTLRSLLCDGRVADAVAAAASASSDAGGA